MKPHSQKPESRIIFATRILTPAIVIASLLSALAPLGKTAPAEACTMACCKGKPSHASGASCNRFSHVSQKRTAHVENLCGLRLNTIRAVAESPVPAQPNSEAPTPVARRFSQPCPTICTTCATSFTNRRPREASGLSPVMGLRSPLIVYSRRTSNSQPNTFAEQLTQLHPRAPPRISC